MDIVYVNQTFGRGGAEEFNKSLIKFLSQTHSVSVYSNSDQFSAHKVPFSVDLIGDWKGFIKGLFYLIPLQLYYFYIIYRNYNASIYYFTGFIEKILLTPWLKLLGKKVIWIEFGPLDTVVSKFLHLPEFLYRFAARFPDKIIFSSKNSLTQNKKYYPASKKLSVIPLGSPKPPPVKPVAPFDVLCLSRLEPGKGQDLLIKAWQKIKNATLFIAGEGDQNYVSYLKSLIGDHKNIKLLGRVKNKYAYLKACKFFVFPSIWELEGFGLVITEAFSMGKPVVAYDRPPGNELIKSGYNGLLSDDLVKNIEYLLKNPKICHKLGINARQDFTKNYREDIYLQKYADSLLS